MAINLMCAVLDRGPENLSEMAVLLALADGADRDSGETWPSHRTIAKRSRQTERSVRNVLERLRAGGWVTWEMRTRANGSRASNVYTLNLAKLGETPRNHVPGRGNHVPPPPEPRSGHAPEPRSALEPSQKKETARAKKNSAALKPRHRSPHESGGGAAVGLSGDLSRFERSQIRLERPVVIGGELMQPGTDAFNRLAVLIAESDRGAEKGLML